MKTLYACFPLFGNAEGVVASPGLQTKNLKARRPHFFAQAGRVLGAAQLRHGENEHWSTENYQTERKGMCQTALIADNIARLSMRSYRHRQEVATPDAYRASQLARLNRALGSLCELLYDQWQTVTEDDYRRFGGQLQLLIETLRGLYQSIRRLPKSMGLAVEAERLEENYSELRELNRDIINFRIRLPKNERLHQLMADLTQT